MLCNDVQREGVKPCPDLASELFCYMPLHNIRYGINWCRLTDKFAEKFFRDKNVMGKTERTFRFWRSRERCFLLF
jgi:hypothetical protein